MHPDHFLGNQAFEDRPIAALPGTIDGIRTHGEDFNDNMYRLVGPWMAGTRVVLPTEAAVPGEHTIGGHRLRLLALRGHTGSDLAILDRTTGVLFAGDLVFNGRTPTTPNADIAAWLASLKQLHRLHFSVLVPGHGDVATDAAPIEQTADYLRWLRARLARAAESGDTMAETLQAHAPARIRALAVFDREYPRSVAHLFPALEARALAHGRVEKE
jgi:uncharacterized sulfatase